MLEQHLDKGGEWVTVDQFTASRDLINYQFETLLEQRADAVLVYVTIPNAPLTWNIAGEFIQLWDTDEVDYQTAYDRVRLQQRTVVEIAPLATSRLLFRPVEWLRGWTIEVKARSAPLSNRDILSQVITIQQTVAQDCSGCECKLDSSETIAQIHTKLDAICQHLGIGEPEPEPEPEPDSSRFWFLN